MSNTRTRARKERGERSPNARTSHSHYSFQSVGARQDVVLNTYAIRHVNRATGQIL
jgi:hypothetical protein